MRVRILPHRRYDLDPIFDEEHEDLEVYHRSLGGDIPNILIARRSSDVRDVEHDSVYLTYIEVLPLHEHHAGQSTSIEGMLHKFRSWTQDELDQWLRDNPDYSDGAPFTPEVGWEADIRGTRRYDEGDPDKDAKPILVTVEVRW